MAIPIVAALSKAVEGAETISKAEKMSEIVKEQILAIRETGITNMFDLPVVQRLAYERGYYELVCWMEEHRKEYAHFIMTGEADMEDGNG